MTTPTPGNHGAAIDGRQLLIPNAARLESDALELYTVQDFLSAADCDRTIGLIRSRLRPSVLTQAETGEASRTSQTCDLGSLADPFMQSLDQRICQLVGIDSAYSETTQGQFYQAGQFYKAHTDYFQPAEMKKYGGAMGQRTYTCMIYLNPVPSGGETEFPRLGIKVSPRPGLALIWNSLNADGSPNLNSLHHAHTVGQGYKAVITKWFRSDTTKQPKPRMLLRDGYFSRMTVPL